MNAAKVNADYRITIPKEIREQFKLKPGQKIQVKLHNGVVDFIPLKEMKGRKHTGE